MITHHSKARQRGAALVLFLGVVVALSVLSIALVGLISNARHLTSRDKSRTTAFDVAEAAIDVTMQALSGGWPTEEHPWTPASFATKAPGFAAEFGVTNGATQGDAVWVSVVDDPAGSTTGYDEDTNSRVWVDAQARVNGVSARIRAMVQAKFYEMNVPKGVAVCADGSLYSNAADGNTSVGQEQDRRRGRVDRRAAARGHRHLGRHPEPGGCVALRRPEPTDETASRGTRHTRI